MCRNIHKHIRQEVVLEVSGKVWIHYSIWEVLEAILVVIIEVLAS